MSFFQRNPFGVVLSYYATGHPFPKGMPLAWEKLK